MTPIFIRRSLQAILFFILSSLSVVSQPSSWQSRGVGGGGSLFFPTINPADDNEFYIACDMGQLFHSTNFGLNYTQVPFTRLQAGRASTYEFTNNNNIAYCITNDGNINYAVRTMDGGNSWTTLPGNPLTDDLYVLKADHANPGRIVIGYYGTIYISNNYGADFSMVRQAANSGVGLIIGGVFFDGDNIYIGTNEGVLFSSNGGNSFSVLNTTGMPANEGIFSFAAAKSGGITRFFCISFNVADLYNGIQPWEYYGLIKGVYTMDAGTNTWIKKINGININTDFLMYVGMARNNINTVYLAGNDNTTGGNSVLKTTDGGNSWSKVFLTNNNQNIRTGWSGQGGDRSWGYGETCFGIAVAPGNVNKVLFGDFGFVHTSSDGGNSWQQAYVSKSDEHPAAAPTPPKQYYHSIGLENTSVWQLHWQNADNMFACFSDIRGLRSKDAGISWGFDYAGYTANTMYRIAKHNTNTTMFAATSGVHDMYQSTRLTDALLDADDPSGSIIYSADDGANWQLLHQFNHPVFWVATDPTNSNRLYASVIHYNGGSGEGGIWRTNDLNNLGSSSWTKLANPPRSEGHPATIVVLDDGKVVCTYSGRRTGAGFTASSGVFLYDPAQGIWTDLSDEGMHYWTKDIVIDPQDATQSTWYVAVFSGWGGAPNGKGGLYRTNNRGASWTKLTGTQFDRVTSISFNPSVNNEAYLTTEMQGLWRSANIRAVTPSWSLVENYPFRQPERVFFNPYNPAEIWITSFGDGLKLGIQSITLPLKLLSFSGNRIKDISTLHWTATDAEAGDSFIIERSTDAENFTSIGSVAVTAFASSQYKWEDSDNSPVLYYRIKINNATGNITYSNTIKLMYNPGAATAIRLLQNPVQHIIPLEIIAENNGNSDIQLIDIAGRNMLKQIFPIQKGNNQLSINVPENMSNGIYFIKIKTAFRERIIRVMVAP